LLFTPLPASRAGSTRRSSSMDCLFFFMPNKSCKLGSSVVALLIVGGGTLGESPIFSYFTLLMSYACS
jgi:hypothetical protein